MSYGQNDMFRLVFVSPVLRPIQDRDRTGKRPEKTGPVVLVFHFRNRKTAKRPVLKDQFTSVSDVPGQGSGPQARQARPKKSPAQPSPVIGLVRAQGWA